VLRYTTASTLAIQRPPWEANQFMREELSTTVSNRSAAYFEAGDHVSALVDAETVIAIRRNWPKGHYRRAKALRGLGRPREAADALKLGLSYEPTNAVRLPPLISGLILTSLTGTLNFPSRSRKRSHGSCISSIIICLLISFNPCTYPHPSIATHSFCHLCPA
jgi:hypothetical protein